MKVVITGGSGNLGQQVVRELLEAGHEVLSLDRVIPPTRLCPSLLIDLVRIGDLYQALRGADGLVHLAAYQAPNLVPDAETFANNATAAYNVLKATTDLCVSRVVLASSIAAYGLLYAPRLMLPPPDYLPLDEEHPTRPQDPYGLSKVVTEEIAASFARTVPTVITSLRLAGINFDPTYRAFAQRWVQTEVRLRGFWSYVDARDAANAVRLALEWSREGHHVFNVAAPISAMPESTDDLIARYLPQLREVRAPAGLAHWSGISSKKAEQLLGFRAQHLWTNYLSPSGVPR